MNGGMTIKVSGSVMEKDSFPSRDGQDTLRYVVIGWLGGSHKQYVSEDLFNQLPEVGDAIILEGSGESTDKGLKMRKPSLSELAGMDVVGSVGKGRRRSAG